MPASFTTEMGSPLMNALQERFSGLWLVVGIGVGTALGVATGYDAIGLALGAAAGIFVGAVVGNRRG
jgi:hypothetical protein